MNVFSEFDVSEAKCARDEDQTYLIEQGRVWKFAEGEPIFGFRDNWSSLTNAQQNYLASLSWTKVKVSTAR